VDISDPKDDTEQNPDALTYDREAVYRPLDMALAQKGAAGGRTTLTAKITPLRKVYLDELKGDLHEINTEIMQTDSLKEALSLLNTKYALERNILAYERNLMAEEGTLLGEKRTTASIQRTEMAENRSGLSRMRTLLAKHRGFLAEKRTLMAQQRTFLAKARTELAFIRTGVAFLALATGLMRYFGFGWWTVMDGSILLCGAAMVGTGIYYYLPTRKREGRLIDIIRQKEEELMRRKPRIMVLDDDPAVCDMLKVYLRKAGWMVEAFTNPYVARQRLEVAQFDVAITDFMMNGMSGIEILHLIRRLSPGTQVILISRMEMLDEFVKDIKSELFDYFSKPVDIKKLTASVRRALEERMLL